MILDFVFDEFEGTELDAAWLARNSPGQAETTWTVIDGKLRVTMPAGDPTGLGCYFWLEQPADYPTDLVTLPDDIYCKFIIPGTLPGAPAWGYNVFLSVYDEDFLGFYEGGAAVQFTWDNVTGPYQWSVYGWADWDEWGEYTESTPIGVGNPTACWLRVKSPPGKIAKIYYALTEPEYDTDWIEISLESGYIKPSTAIGYVQLSVQGDCEYLSTDTNFYLEHVSPWVGKPPGVICRGRQINFKNNTPASVGEMKDGEIRVIDENLYGRVDNQVLLKNLGVYLPTTTTTTTT